MLVPIGPVAVFGPATSRSPSPSPAATPPARWPPAARSWSRATLRTRARAPSSPACCRRRPARRGCRRARRPTAGRGRRGRARRSSTSPPSPPWASPDRSRAGGRCTIAPRPARTPSPSTRRWARQPDRRDRGRPHRARADAIAEGLVASVASFGRPAVHQAGRRVRARGRRRRRLRASGRRAADGPRPRGPAQRAPARRPRAQRRGARRAGRARRPGGRAGGTGVPLPPRRLPRHHRRRPRPRTPSCSTSASGRSCCSSPTGATTSCSTRSLVSRASSPAPSTRARADDQLVAELVALLTERAGRVLFDGSRRGSR